MFSQGVNGNTQGNRQSEKRIGPRTGLSGAPRLNGQRTEAAASGR